MTLKHFIQASLLMATMALCTSCIKNDIPYPYIEGAINQIEVEGMTGEAKIDPTRRVVEITVGEEPVLSEITVTKLVTNDEATIIPDENSCLNFSQFPQTSFSSLSQLPANANTRLDCTKPVNILLKTYQDYIWTLKVTQEINRTIEADHQMGTPLIDVTSRMAIVYVDKETELTNINITSMNLEGESATIVPDPTTVKDFTRPRKFDMYKNERLVSTWTVDVQHTELTSTTGDAEAWATKATLYGGMKSGTTPVIEYKKASASTWTELPADQVTLINKASFKASLTGLTDGTDYEWRIVIDGEAGDAAQFTTEKIAEVPYLDFDTWTQDGKNWYLGIVADNYENPQAYWASGNEGVTSGLAGGKDAITQPVSGSDAYKGKAARLNSLTGINLVGAAAGNLFIGTYKTNMGNPSASPQFGRAFTGARPSGMKGYYKYTSCPITNGGTVPGNLTMDQGHIYFKLWDSNDMLIAYGEFVATETVTTYQPFEFKINYSDTQAKPAKMTIVATSSRYGGEFKGAKVVGQVGEGSTLWVDEFELLYD